MAQTLQLRPYQQQAATFLYENDRAMILAPVGAGKTAITLTAMDEMLRDGIVNWPSDQVFVDQTLGQYPNRGVMRVDEPRSWDRRRNGRMLRGQDNVINRALRTTEMPVDRESPGDVRRISIEFTTGIDE